MKKGTLAQIVRIWSYNKQPEDEQIIRNLIKIESNGSKELCGYRAIWHALHIKHHIYVPRQEVECNVCELHPDAARKRHEGTLRHRMLSFNFGPNFCWHVDGEQADKSVIDLLSYYMCCCVVLPFGSNNYLV